MIVWSIQTGLILRQFAMMKELLDRSRARRILACLAILTFTGIGLWNQHAPLPIHDWNTSQSSRIRVTDPDHFSFAVFGDNKGNYSFFEPLLDSIDQDKDIAFAIDIGDLVADGRRGQYRRFLDQVQETLAIPFLAATGNHDYHNGFDEYQTIFGPTYYSFQAGRCVFIVLDSTNESGFDKTELQWLEGELNRAQGAKARFVFMHIPPFDPRGGRPYLPEKDRHDLLELFKRYNVTHLFASHVHGYFSGVWEGIPYTITGGAGARLQGNDPEHFFHHYTKVQVNSGEVELAVRRIDARSIMASLYDLAEDHLVEGGLLLCAGVCMLTPWFPVRKQAKLIGKLLENGLFYRLLKNAQGSRDASHLPQAGNPEE